MSPMGLSVSYLVGSIHSGDWAQPTTRLNLPVFTTNSRWRMKCLERIIIFLDRIQRIIVATIKCLLPVWLLGIRLSEGLASGLRIMDLSSCLAHIASQIWTQRCQNRHPFCRYSVCQGSHLGKIGTCGPVSGADMCRQAYRNTKVALYDGKEGLRG